MRKTLVLILASTFLTSSPVVIPQAAHAQSLFESLFPRAAERRRQRRYQRQRSREREMERIFQRQRQQEVRERRKKRVPRVVAKVKAATFKKYAPRAISAVALAKLAAPFSAFDQKLLAAYALDQERLKQAPTDNTNDERADVPTGGIQSGVQSVDIVQASQTSLSEKPVQEALKPEVELPAVRLSAGSDLLQSIALKAAPSLSKGLVKYYTKNPIFVWLDENGKPNQRATMLSKELARADEYGLRSADYTLPELTVGDEATEQDILLAAIKYEFALTIAALQYMMDARHGLVDPNRISGYHDFKGLKLDFQKELEALAEAERPDHKLVSAHPKDKSFDVLKAELAELRELAEGYQSVTVKRGTFLKPGQTSDQLANVVESIRRKASKDFVNEHFDVFAVDHSDGEYTPEVVEMVRDFQRSVKLKPDGIIGRNTIARMNGSDPKVRLNKVKYAIERLRWHPDQLGATHVFINQPAYKATFVKNGRPEFSTRTVVGKMSNQTYFFHDKIEYVEFNPYWGIPRSILVNEMLPKLRRNPSYFDNIGYEMTNTRGRRVYSSEVDWYSVGANFPYNVRQPPGRKNALGELKIMFPNKHSIYMHDTPAKSLFKRRERAFSHGCVRLAEPRKMAAAVLGTSINKVEARLSGGDNNQQRLKVQVPVYVSYFTAWPNDNGDVSFFKDIYGRDNALGKALELEAKARARARGA